MKDLIKVYDSNVEKRKSMQARGEEELHRFDLKPRSHKKCRSESIVLHSKHTAILEDRRSLRFHPRSFGREPLRASEVLPSKLEYDCRIVKDRLNHFYLCVPMPLEKRAGTGENQARVVSIDPGVCKFATCYDPSGLVTEFGSGDMKRIQNLCQHIDRLQSTWSQPEVRHKRRYRLRRAALRLQERVRNLVEAHKKIASYLVDHYDFILLPTFPTQKMVKKAERVLASKTARNMLTWAHYRFQQRLLHKARERVPCQVILCTEEYTSKTCGRCGFIHSKLGGQEHFVCKKCGYEVDRDLNGARNILIKYLSLGPSPSEN